MSQQSDRFDLLNDVNDRVLGIRDRLSGRITDEMPRALILAFFDLGAIFEELQIDGFTNTCEDLQQILTMVDAGKMPFTDLIKECVIITLSLMYRKAINDEPCLQEIEDLALLVQGVKLGDSEGFQVTDQHIPTDRDEQICLFDDDDEPTVTSSDHDAQATISTPAPNPAPDPVPQSIPNPSHTPPPTPRPASGRPLNMLVVDDELSCRVLMRHIVAPYGTYDFAINGSEAVQACQLAHESGTPYDVVFMDIMMPEMDGHQALQEIRAFEQKACVPPGKEIMVFMTTCLDSHDNVCRAFFKGYCTDYITKPITSAKILDKMREYRLLPSPPDQGPVPVS